MSHVMIAPTTGQVCNEPAESIPVTRRRMPPWIIAVEGVPSGYVKIAMENHHL